MVGGGVGSFGLDLGAGGEGDEWVAGVVWLVYWVLDVQERREG